MPSGVFKVTDIPDDKVETVIALYRLDNPDKIDKEKQPNNLWTVTATFPGDGGETKTFSG
jgi:hypothetical protein